MTERPRPRPRARKPQAESSSDSITTAKKPEQDDLDLFANRRRFVQQVKALHPDEELLLAVHHDDYEGEDTPKKRGRKRKPVYIPEWMREKPETSSSKGIGEDLSGGDEHGSSTAKSSSVDKSSTLMFPPIPTLPPIREFRKQAHALTSPPDEEDDESALPALDPIVLAAIQARQMMRGESSRTAPGNKEGKDEEGQVQIRVHPQLDPRRVGGFAFVGYTMVKEFDHPRKDPLVKIYEALGARLGIINPLENIILAVGEKRIWSAYAKVDSLNIQGDKIDLVMYERYYYEQVEKEKKEAERVAFQARIAEEEQARAQALALHEQAEDEDEANAREDAASDTSGVEAIEAPKQGKGTPVISTPVPEVETIKVVVRGKEGELDASITPTTTYDAVIKWYAGKKNIPVLVPKSGRGMHFVKEKKLKIDFDGDLFDGAGKVVDLDLDGGETLDVKYV